MYNLDIEVQEFDMDINDPRFAQAMAHKLDEHIRATARRGTKELQ